MVPFKTFFSLLLVATLFIIQTGCKPEPTPEPEPTACINPVSGTVETGTSVTLTNCSTNASTYKWTVSGQSYTSKDVTLTFTTNGDKVVTLEAFSESGDKKSETSVTIQVANPNEKYVGVYNMLDNCTFTHNVTATASGTNVITISDFIEIGTSITANVSGNNVTVPAQTVSTADGYYDINGSGTLSGNTLTINYTYAYTDNTNPGMNTSGTCTATLNKQ